MTSYFVKRHGRQVAFWAGVAGILTLFLTVFDGGPNTVINVNPNFEQRTETSASADRSNPGGGSNESRDSSPNIAPPVPLEDHPRGKRNEPRNVISARAAEIPWRVAAPFPRRSPATSSDGELHVDVVSQLPLILRVEGHQQFGSAGDEAWIGTLSYPRFWPQVKLPSDIPVGRKFSYTLPVPSDVHAGEVVLLSAGPDAQQEFRNLLSSRLTGVGLSLAHIPDVVLRSRTAFP